MRLAFMPDFTVSAAYTAKRPKQALVTLVGDNYLTKVAMCLAIRRFCWASAKRVTMASKPPIVRVTQALG